MSAKEFNQVLLENADFLKPFAINLTRDNEAANDLYQETLYKAWPTRKNIMQVQILRHGCLRSCEIFLSMIIAAKSKQKTIFDNTPNDYLINLKQVSVNNRESSLRMKEIKKLFTVAGNIQNSIFVVF